jgi:hypothetical protein
MSTLSKTESDLVANILGDLAIATTTDVVGCSRNQLQRPTSGGQTLNVDEVEKLYQRVRELNAKRATEVCW